MKDILLQYLLHSSTTHTSEHRCSQTRKSLCSNQAEVKVDLHTAAGGDLTPVSEPCDLWPGKAVYSWCMDKSTLTLGYSLRPFTLHKTTHV